MPSASCTQSYNITQKGGKWVTGARKWDRERERGRGREGQGERDRERGKGREGRESGGRGMGV